jgi:hypothetical protein
MERELTYLGDALAAPRRPFVAILGGAKISGKIDVISALLPKVDRLIIGGAMACTFFKAMGLETGKSLVEADRVPMAKELLASAGDKLMLPDDALVAPAIDAPAASHAVARERIPASEAMFDIGPRSAERFARAIAGAKTVVWNGPMGVFEKAPFDAGTRAVADAMARATASGATTIVGGGDSAAAVEQMGLADRMSHVSTRLRGELEDESRRAGCARLSQTVRRALAAAYRPHIDLLPIRALRGGLGVRAQGPAGDDRGGAEHPLGGEGGLHRRERGIHGEGRRREDRPGRPLGAAAAVRRDG